MLLVYVLIFNNTLDVFPLLCSLAQYFLVFSASLIQYYKKQLKVMSPGFSPV